MTSQERLGMHGWGMGGRDGNWGVWGVGAGLLRWESPGVMTELFRVMFPRMVVVAEWKI